MPTRHPLAKPLAAILSLLVSLAPASAADPAGQERPNLVWITAEDMSATLGCYGDPDARTPHLDRLAGRSVRFTHAFATAPVCSPARSTLITGLYATSLGTQRLRSDFPLPDAVHGFPALLRGAGYFTTNDVKTDYNTASEPRLVRESWDRSAPGAHWRDRPDADQPFFHVANDMTTHQSRTSVWPHQRFVEEVQSGLSPDQVHDPASVNVPPYYPDTPVVRKTLARFHDCVTAMDQHVDTLLGQLEADGLADDTIVFFFSDHGSGLPRHKRVLYDSGLHVPLIVHFPEKWSHLAPSAPGSTSDRLVSFVDFAPTVLALAGIVPPAAMQGRAFLGPDAAPPPEFVFGARDRVDEAYDVARSVRDRRFLYIRNFMPHLAWAQPDAYSMQSEISQEIARLRDAGELDAAQLDYAAAPRPVEQLFDTAADPHNLVNLAGDPAHKAKLQQLRDEAFRWADRTRDLGFVPELLARQRSAGSTPFESSRNLRAWPVFNYRGAALSVFNGEHGLPVNVADLYNEDPVIRFWGLVGINASPAEPGDDPDIDAAVSRCLADDAPPVRIEAARFKRDHAALAAELGSDDPETVLGAMRALELLGAAAAPAHDAVREAYERWRPRTDTPLALFIRFSAEATLGIRTEF